MNKLIAFTGIKGSGKDTACNFLIAEFGERVPAGLTVQFAFADILKNIIHEGFNLSNREAGVLKRMNVKPFNGLTLRQVYQQLGETIKSRLGENIWVDITLERLKDFLDTVNPDLMCLTDLRYLNEEAALRKFAEDNGLDLYIIKMINTNLDETDSHVSETQIPEIQADFIIKASTTEEIEIQIQEIFNELY